MHLSEPDAELHLKMLREFELTLPRDLARRREDDHAPVPACLDMALDVPL